MGSQCLPTSSLLSLLLAFCSLLLKTSSLQSYPDVADYCEDEAFQAECAEDEVIVMKTARYGRMRLNRCITSGFGQMGCWSNVLKHFDQWCSGRQSCDVGVRDLVIYADPACSRELRSYLLASYVCEKATKMSVKECHSGQMSLVTSSTGYLASVVTQKTGCGSIDAPWLVQTYPGQTINITLVDFAPKEEQISPGGDVMCQVLAVVKETERSDTICRGRQREQLVYQSLSNEVEIRLMVKRDDSQNQAQFLLKYEVTGCPDIPLNEATWFKRTKDGATVGCEEGDQRWPLKCQGHTWQGSYYNCSNSAEEVPAAKKTFPFGISIAIIIIIALTIGSLVLIVGLVCVRRRRFSQPSQLPTRSKVPQKFYASGERPPSGDVPPNDPALCSGFGENAYFRTWELQRPSNISSSMGGSSGPGGGGGGGGGSSSIPAYPSASRDLPSYSQAVDGHSDRYSEHIYESPKSIRRDKPSCNGNESLQYYELDPHAMDKSRVEP